MVRNKMSIKRIILWIGLCLYLGFILWITVFNRTPDEEMRYELMPFWSWKESIRELQTVQSDGLIKQIVRNLCFMIPLGIMLHLLWSIKARIGALAGLGLSLSIELMQLVFRLGLFEWDDMIHNAFGCMMGVWIAKIIATYWKESMDDTTKRSSSVN